jgi:predicted amidohydrolase YtcJ
MGGTLFTNAKVWQPDGTFAEAFGITDGSFSFVGTTPEANSLKPLYLNSIDLNGRLVIPGLTDGHLHLVKGSLMRKVLDCTKINTRAELKGEIKNYVKENNPSWIIGGNLDINKVLKGYGTDNGNIADEFFEGLPLYITNYDYHSAICNTKAIEVTGLSGRIKDYSADEIEISSTGKPTGILRENGLSLIISSLPEPSIGEKVNAVSEFIEVLHSYGITSVSDITLPADIDVYIELFKAGKLNLRVNSYLPFTEFDKLQYYLNKTKEIDPDYFTINGFKAYWDGALGSETALFSKNYNERNHNGYKTELVQSGKIYELAKRIDAAGWQMVIHAIGDLAVKEVLDLYETLPNTKQLRHRIEHAQHIQPDDYRRFSELGVIASVQPIHLKYDARSVYEMLPELLRELTHNYLHLINSSGIVNFGTDFPIVEADPFENIRIAATRITEHGEFTPELNIPLHECIKAYTSNNAYSNHNEYSAGSITKGKAADFVVLEDDIFEISREQLGKVRVHKTFLGGNELYSGI